MYFAQLANFGFLQLKSSHIEARTPNDQMINIILSNQFHKIRIQYLSDKNMSIMNDNNSKYINDLVKLI